MGAPTSRHASQRLSTGIHGLDVILHGGFLAGDLYLVRGASGTGKTVFGHQFCFSRAALGSQALYVTLLSEAHGRLVTHLQSFAFFRPEWIAQRVHYLSAYSALKEGGLPGLLKLIGTEIHRIGVDTLVIDGLGTASSAAADPLVIREFLHGIEAHATLAGCTTLITEIAGEAVTGAHEGQMDGIVVLSSESFGLRTLRTLEVTKIRGSGQMTGKHYFDITRRGLEVYPRSEALITELPLVQPDPSDRCAFGISGLDAMLDGGVARYSSTLLQGTTGCGKTLLGLHFLAEGARRGEQGLYVGFSETPEHLVRKAQGVSLNLDEPVKHGTLRFDVHVRGERLRDALLQNVIALCRERRVRRLYIDNLEPFTHEALDPTRAGPLMTALLDQVRSVECTVVVAYQLPTSVAPEQCCPRASNEARFDNLVSVQVVERDAQLRRRVTILKARDSESDPCVRELRISSDGVSIAKGTGEGAP